MPEMVFARAADTEKRPQKVAQFSTPFCGYYPQNLHVFAMTCIDLRNMRKSRLPYKNRAFKRVFDSATSQLRNRRPGRNQSEEWVENLGHRGILGICDKRRC